jgi:hypothetical protein
MALVLKHILAILESQRTFIKGNKRLEEAWRLSIRLHRQYYYKRLMVNFWSDIRNGGHRKRALRNMLALFTNSPAMLASAHGTESLSRLIRKGYAKLLGSQS